MNSHWLFESLFPLCVIYCFSPSAFQISSLSLISRNLILICLSVIFIVFILLGFWWAICIYEFVVFIKFDMFPVFISLIFFFPSFGPILSHFSFWDSRNTNVRPLPHKSMKLCLLFFQSFLSTSRLYDLYWFIFIFTDSFFSHSISAVKPINFYFRCYIFQFQNFSFLM